MRRLGTVTGKSIADVGEFGLISIIKEMLPATDPRVVIGIGDDTAAVRPTPGMLTLATCDIQVEGRHFRREQISPWQLGRRSAAINLSDIGAMGGRPLCALVSLALPPETELAWVEELYVGLHEELQAFGASVIGGNLSSAEGVVIDITLLGEVREEEMVRRRGARVGDAILVTDYLGASAIGRLALERRLDTARPEVAHVVARHRTPSPRVREGAVIGASRKATAMIDVSDGLAGDLGHICGASGVGARLFAQRIPTSPQARAVARELGADLMQAALHGGEDYELALTCPPNEAHGLIAAVQTQTGTPVTEIGVITPGPGMTLVLPNGREEALAGGWDHFVKSERR